MGYRLLLIDGANYFYRSFYAIRNLSTKDGHPTNAVFGFVRACHQLIHGLSPTHVAVAWDAGIPKARLELVPEYKAQRPAMPEALREQYPHVEEYLRLARVPLVRLTGEEADDVLASLAGWAGNEGADVLLATGDKDMYQLVKEGVWVVPPAKDGPLVDAKGVRDKTGVHPWQIVDWLALTGDAVDNIPGVPGLGPKTAAKLLTQFESVDGIWTRMDEIDSAKMRDNLMSHRDRVERNRLVVKLNPGLDCSPGWSEMERRVEDPERLRSFYGRMEFHSLLNAMDQGSLLI